MFWIKFLLQELTNKIPPGAGQQHSIYLENDTLILCLMLGDVYLPITLEPQDFSRDASDIVQDIANILNDAGDMLTEAAPGHRHPTPG